MLGSSSRRIDPVLHRRAVADVGPHLMSLGFIALNPESRQATHPCRRKAPKQAARDLLGMCLAGLLARIGR